MSVTNVADSSRDRVAALAYELWQTEGYPADRALDHWCAAEQMLQIQETEMQTAPARPAPVKPRRRAARRSRPVTQSA
ncbi:DUF2934 domain-containing protein [Planctomycetales bacterium ZRK34]|nr:DUF2934 domain-containing protein [Planctomycetales bacterium ZRK34]